MSHNIFGTGTQPTLFKGKIQNNCEQCANAGDSILTCEDVTACVNLNFFANLTNPYIPYWDGDEFRNTPLYRVKDGATINVALDRGTSFRSHIAGEAQFGFDASGDGINMSTDGATYNESFFLLQPTEIRLLTGGGTDGVIFSSALHWITAKAATKIYLNTPLTHVDDNTKFDVNVMAGTYSMFDTNASLVSIGRSGATLNILSTLAMTSAQLQLAAGTTSYSSMYIASGVAPTTPADGDIWFDGTDLKMRVGGVTKTFTLV